jgi:hypothetical protein
VRPRTKTPRLVAVVVAAGVAVSMAAVAMAAGCSSSPTTGSVASLPGHGSTTQPHNQLSSSQTDQDMINFARCLRSHGVNEPDPAPRPGHTGLSVSIPTRNATTGAALDACDHFLAPLIQAKQAHAQSQLASWLPGLTRYAECMRNHDIPMLDPDQNGSLNLGNVPGITSDFGRYSPQFRAADTACRHLLPAGVHDNGSGP